MRRLHPNCSEWDYDLNNDITEDEKKEVAKIRINIDKKLVTESQAEQT